MISFHESFGWAWVSCRNLYVIFKAPPPPRSLFSKSFTINYYCVSVSIDLCSAIMTISGLNNESNTQNLVPRGHSLLGQRLVVARWNSWGMENLVFRSLPLTFIVTSRTANKEMRCLRAFHSSRVYNLATATADQ